MLRITCAEVALLAAGLAAASGCGSAEPEPSDAQAFVDWARDHAIAVEGIDPRKESADLGPFGEAIGSARVVGLGESRHDTREQLLMKGVLIRYLVEDLGFRAVILEESFSHAEALDRFVRTGHGDLREIMNGLAGWYLWDTEEMLEWVVWVRQFNEERHPDQQVRIFGMDVTAPAEGVRTVLDALEEAGTIRQVSVQGLGLELQRGDFWPVTWERYAALSDERRLELSVNYDELVEVVHAERSTIIGSFSVEAHERILRAAEIGRFGNALFSSANREQGGEIRERGMAETVLWILEREIPGGKAILWAHNLHVAKSSFRMPGLAEGVLEPMAVRLSDELGADYLAIGATFGTGTYPANVPPGEREFAKLPEEVIDGTLDNVGLPSFLIDLREVKGDSAAAKWLHQEREWTAQDSSAVLVPDAAFDLVYFVNEISRSHPTPLALERFRSLGGSQ